MNQPPPNGYELGEARSDLWRVGYVFRWSGVYETWLDCNHRITVKPQETVAEAYERETDTPCWCDGVEVFFNKDM